TAPSDPLLSVSFSDAYLHLVLRSFPTRRSSDLLDAVPLDLLASHLFGKPLRRAVVLRPVELDGDVALRIVPVEVQPFVGERVGQDRKSTRLNSSHVKISYAVFCLKKKNWRERQV